MDGIPELDTDKFAAVAQRYSRNSLVDSARGIFCSVILIVASIWKEPIANYFNTSNDMVLLVGCIPTGLYLIFFYLSWRRRENDSRAYFNAMYEFQMNCEKRETAIKSGIS